MSSDRPSRHPLLRVADWPPSVRAAWQAANATSSSLFAPGAGQALSAASRQLAEQGLCKLLTILTTRDLLVGSTGISDIVTETNLVAMVEHMQAEGLALRTQITYLGGVARAARILAPTNEWGWVQTGINRLKSCTTSRSLISQTHISSADMLLIGKEIFREAWNDHAARDMDRAVRARDGLILAFLSVRPLRRRTLAALELGKHIQIYGDDVQIHVPASLMKGNNHPHDSDWPAPLKPELIDYINTVRPILLAGRTAHVGNSSAGDALWVSDRGSMLTADAIYRRIRQVTRQTTGQAINLHRFRNIAASTVAIYEPEQIDISQQVLGHSDPRSKEFYIQADQLVAARRSHRIEDEILQMADKEWLLTITTD